MKYLLIIFSLLLTSVSWSKDVDSEDLVTRDGLIYEKFTDKPFTGKSTGKEQGKVKKGKRTGKWKIYYESGALEISFTAKNGKPDGEYLEFWENGKLAIKGNKKEGIEVGEWYEYNKSGDLIYTIIYSKDGDLIEEIKH